MMDRGAHICACGAHGFVKLSKWHTALFDPEDMPKIAGHVWSVDAKRGRAYAIRAIGPRRKRQFVYMHREVAAPPDGMDVDHINQADGTDNRKANLRIADRSLNNANQRPKGGASRFKGVHFHKQTKKWHAQIRFRGMRKSLGLHATEEDAARAYDRAAASVFGPFAQTNAGFGLLNSENPQ
ncbi:AP2 domain-containing protein [Paracoccus pantotrophus]|nr:AP2 domain-containing protein [Paracoccus pantotrophus]